MSSLGALWVTAVGLKPELVAKRSPVRPGDALASARIAAKEDASWAAWTKIGVD